MNLQGLLIALIVLIATPVTNGETVSETVRCPTEVMNSLPHLGLALQAVNADLGSYAPVVEAGEACGAASDSDALCTSPGFDEVLADPLTYVQNGEYRGDAENIANYVEHVALYVAVGVVLAVGTILGSIGYCMVRCCGSRCTPDQTRKYNTRQVLTVYFLLGSFVIANIALVSVGHFKGNVGFTSCQLALANSPTNAAKMVQDMIVPIKSAAKQVVGVTVPVGLRRINGTLNEEVDIASAAASMACAQTLVSTASEDAIKSFQTVVAETTASLQQLPDLTQVSATVQDIRVNATAIVDLVAQVQSDIAGIQSYVAGTRDTVVLVGGRVSGLETKLADMSASLSSVKTEATAIVALETSLVSTRAALSAVVTVPYTSAILSAADAGVTDSRTKADAANPQALATELSTLNSTIDDVVQELGFFVIELGLASASVGDQSTIQALNSTLDLVLEGIDALDVAVLRPISEALLVSVNNQFGPSADAFKSVFETLDNIEGQVACAMKMFDVIDSIEQGIVELPPFVTSIKDIVRDLNSTITDAFSEVGNSTSQFNNTDQLDQVTEMVESINKTITDVEMQIVSTRQVVIDAKLEIASSASSTSSSTNYTQIIVDMQALQDDLSSNPLRPSQADIDALNQGQTSLVSTKDSLGNLDGVMDSLALLPSGQSFTCATSGGTPSTTSCYRYDEVPSLLPVKDAGSTCAAAVAGSPGCMFNYEAFDEAIAGIDSFQANLDSMGTSLSGSVLPGIDSAQADIAGAEFNCCADQLTSIDQLISTLADTHAQVSGTSSDLDDQLATLDDVKTSISDAQSTLDGLNGTLSSFEDQLGSLNETIADSIPDGITEMLEFAQDVLALFRQGSLLETAIEAMDISQLESIDTATGGKHFFRDASAQFAQSIDDVLRVFNDTSAPVSSAINSFDSGLSLADQVSHMALRDADEEGSLQLFATLVSSLTAPAGPPAGSPDQRLLGQLPLSGGAPGQENPPNNQAPPPEGQEPSTRDAGFQIMAMDQLKEIESTRLQLMGYVDATSGEFVSYPEGRFCVAKECIENTLQAVNSEPISIAGTDLPLSREMFMFLPFLLPIIMILMAIATCFCGACAAPFYICSLCMAPFIFLIAGGVFFPLTFIPSDVCVSMESLAVTQVEVLSPFVCTAVNGTLSQTGTCEIALGLPGLGDAPLQINFAKTLEAALVTCEHRIEDGSNPGGQIMETLETSGRQEVAQMLQDFLESSNITLRAGMQEDLDVTASLLVTDMLTLLAQILDAAGCEPLRDAYFGFKDAVCCDCIGAMYYWVSSWYLIGFSLLLCGCPGGVLSVSRLHNHQNDPTKIVDAARYSKFSKSKKSPKGKKKRKKQRTKKSATTAGRQVGNSHGTESEFDGLPTANEVPRMVSIPRTRSQSPQRNSRPMSTNGVVRRTTTRSQSPVRHKSTNQRPTSMSRVSQQQYDNIARTVSQNAAGNRVVYVVPGRRQQNNPNVVSALI